MSKTAAIALLLGFVPLWARAQFTDFEDLVVITSYSAGANFTSKGITFNVVNFGGIGSKVHVGSGGDAGGSGKALIAGRLIGVDIQLPSAAEQISLRYGEYCCNSGVEINGVMIVPSSGRLVSLNGTTIGGALVSVTSTGASNDQGMLTATGNIASFAIGGTEFVIDDLGVVLSSVTLPGDYNGDLIVNAADYVLWRNGGPLANDTTPGVQPSDYDVWRSHFGQMAGGGSSAVGSASANSAVPEPASLMLLVLAALALTPNLFRRDRS
jgi:hypothetical protein